MIRPYRWRIIRFRLENNLMFKAMLMFQLFTQLLMIRLIDLILVREKNFKWETESKHSINVMVNGIPQIYYKKSKMVLFIQK